MCLSRSPLVHIDAMPFAKYTERCYCHFVFLFVRTRQYVLGVRLYICVCVRARCSDPHMNRNERVQRHMERVLARLRYKN